MATYFVSNDGDDAGSGQGIDQPWKTISKVNATSFEPGDFILFRRGDTWRERLIVPSSGTSGKPITFATYGGGAKPIISGLSEVTGWSSIGSNRWTATVSEDPLLVIIDNDYGYEVASQAAVTAADEWHWASNTLTVYATSDPDGSMTIEYPTETNACRMAQNWVDFENIRFQGARDYLFFVNNAAADCNWTNVEFYWGHEYGFLTASQYQQSRFTHTNCYSQENGARGLQYNKFNNDHTINGWHSYRDACSPRTDAENEFGGGIKLSGDRTSDAIAGIVIENSLVEYCGVRRDGTRVDTTNKGFAFWSDLIICTSAEKNIWRNNVAHDNAIAGFFCEKTEYSLWHHFLSYDNYTYGVIVGSPYDPAGPRTAYNEFYHFTSVGNGAGPAAVHESNLYCRGGYNVGSTEVFTDNVFKNFILEDGENHEFVARDGAENDGTNGSGNVYEYLAMGAEYAGFVEWGGGVAKNTYAALESAYGSDLNAVTSAITFESDYSLPAGSAAIDAGVAISGYNDDYTNDAPDLGCFESADVTASFTPGTFNQPINIEVGGHGEDFSLWRHYAGVIPTPYVVIITDGVATPSPGIVSPSVHDIKGNAEVPNATASYTGADAGSGDAGLAVFTGGRTYTVTGREKTILVAAGYTMDS